MTRQTTPQQVNLSCHECRHQWHERVELPMDVQALLVRMRAWCTCPNCGLKTKVYMGKMTVDLTLRAHGVVSVEAPEETP